MRNFNIIRQMCFILSKATIYLLAKSFAFTLYITFKIYTIINYIIIYTKLFLKSCFIKLKVFVKIGVSNLTELHVAECHAPATQT